MKVQREKSIITIAEKEKRSFIIKDISSSKEFEGAHFGSKEATRAILVSPMYVGDKLIGATGIHDVSSVHKNAEIGIVIGNKSYWSKGYGTEALRLMLEYGFDQLNLHKIYLWVFCFNTRAIRAYEKVGFKTEGIFREHVYMNGEYCDDHFMGILRSDWQNQQQDKGNI